MFSVVAVIALILAAVVSAIEVWHVGLARRWGRVLFGGWLLISASWIAVVVALGWESVVAPPPAPEATAFECGLPGLPPCMDLRVTIIDDTRVGKLIPAKAPAPPPLSLQLERAEGLAELALLPPIALLVMGVVCAWVLRGARAR
jgi:hypothetical protein